jgi:hypothetical protein
MGEHGIYACFQHGFLFKSVLYKSITAHLKEVVMETPITPSGGKLLSCDLDEACPILDCEADLDDYASTLLESPDGADFVAHYCGLEYLGKWSVVPEEEE